MADVSPLVMQEIDNLSRTLKEQFEKPEFLPGCEIKDVTDKDQYATDNGWIEAVCNHHNQQRVRWKGQYSNVGTGEFVDVLYFPDRRVFEVYSQGGTATALTPSATTEGTFLQVTNTSGSAAAANDVGIINDLLNYSTTTANDPGRICVVTTGGANNAEITVQVRGNTTIAYTGTVPSSGDYLVTSATAGDAQQQTVMRPEVFAVCTAGGSGGTVAALLLTHTRFRPLLAGNDILQLAAASESDFVATMNGAASGTSVVYNAPSSGDEVSINIASSSEWGKIRLYNSTQAEYALISSVDTGTNTITVTDATDVTSWANNDSITTRSQTNTLTLSGGASTSYYYDIEIPAVLLPELTRAIELQLTTKDSGGAGYTATTHPWETGVSSQQIGATSNSTQFLTVPHSTSLIEKRFTLAFESSGSGTRQVFCRLRGIWEAMP